MIREAGTSWAERTGSGRSVRRIRAEKLIVRGLRGTGANAIQLLLIH